jgi:putative transposase
MSRANRINLPGIAHHVTQRGNQRDQVFFQPDDYSLYLTLLRRHASRQGVAIAAYCLMPNHVHFIATPSSGSSLSHFMQRLQGDYSRWINIKLDRGGHTWQSRYYSAALDEPHFWAAMAYVEQNPRRAGLVETAAHWTWSSARAHLADCDENWLDFAIWRTRASPDYWQSALDRGLHDTALLQRIRESTHRGRPLGDDAFTAHVARELNIDLRPRPMGRPRKVTDSTAAAA